MKNMKREILCTGCADEIKASLEEMDKKYAHLLKEDRKPMEELSSDEMNYLVSPKGERKFVFGNLLADLQCDHCGSEIPIGSKACAFSISVGDYQEWEGDYLLTNLKQHD